MGHYGTPVILQLHYSTHMSKILALRPKSQPRGQNAILDAKTPAFSPKSQSQGPNPSLEAQIPAQIPFGGIYQHVDLHVTKTIIWIGLDWIMLHSAIHTILHIQTYHFIVSFTM